MNTSNTNPSTNPAPPPARPRTAPLILSRRGVMRTTAIGALASLLARPLQGIAQEAAAADPAAGPLPYLDRIGLQLYTVRNQMAEDPDATLRAIAAAGYRQVELMNIDLPAVKLAAMARDHGLAVHSAFMNWKAITQPDHPEGPSIDETIQIAERIGLRHVVFGYIGREARDTADKCRKIADTANEAGQKTRAAGMRLCYHNHSFEFAKLDQDGPTAFDLFVKRFDPQKVDFELDVFWAKLGGLDPEKTMRRLAGRITQVHLKDLKADVPTIYDEGQVPVDAFQELGDGTIDMVAVMRLAKEIGAEICHVEQDQSPAPLDSIAQSINYLKSKSAG